MLLLTTFVLFNNGVNLREKPNKTVTLGLISVCIPVFNGSRVVLEALQSVLNQSYANYEMLVSIDSSSDASSSLAAIHAHLKSHPTDKRVEIFAQVNHLGWTGNTNFLLAHANGTYATILPHDDAIP